MNIFSSPNGMYQALDILAAQAAARWQRGEPIWPVQPDGETSGTPTRWHLQKILLPAGAMLIVMLLAVATGRI